VTHVSVGFLALRGSGDIRRSSLHLTSKAHPPWFRRTPHLRLGLVTGEVLCQRAHDAHLRHHTSGSRSARHRAALLRQRGHATSDLAVAGEEGARRRSWKERGGLHRRGHHEPDYYSRAWEPGAGEAGHRQHPGLASASSAPASSTGCRSATRWCGRAWRRRSLHRRGDPLGFMPFSKHAWTW